MQELNISWLTSSQCYLKSTYSNLYKHLVDVGSSTVILQSNKILKWYISK